MVVFSIVKLLLNLFDTFFKVNNVLKDTRQS